ncbi:MAG: type II toxin-antitoxin system RelE/ParE family toxin [Pseudomonadota bacterium]
MKVLTSRSARADLKSLFEYIARDSPKNAHAVLARVVDAVDQLAVTHGAMRKGSLPGTNERVVPRTGCVLIYRVVLDEVLVLRIWRSARGAPRLT